MQSQHETKSAPNDTFLSSTPTDRPCIPSRFTGSVSSHSQCAPGLPLPKFIIPTSWLRSFLFSYLGHQSIALIWNSPQRSSNLVVVFATYRESPNPHLAFLFLRRNATHLGGDNVRSRPTQFRMMWGAGSNSTRTHTHTEFLFSFFLLFFAFFFY